MSQTKRLLYLLVDTEYPTIGVTPKSEQAVKMHTRMGAENLSSCFVYSTPANFEPIMAGNNDAARIPGTTGFE
jgi:hypothetical protein